MPNPFDSTTHSFDRKWETVVDLGGVETPVRASFNLGSTSVVSLFPFGLPSTREE